MTVTPLQNGMNEAVMLDVVMKHYGKVRVRITHHEIR